MKTSLTPNKLLTRTVASNRTLRMTDQKRQKIDHLRTVPVILLGLGSVGTCVINQIYAIADFHAAKYGLRFQFVTLCDSTAFVTSTDFLAEDQVRAILAWKKNKKNLLDFQSGLPLEKLQSTVSDHLERGAIVIDCSATEKTVPFLIHTLQNDGRVVLANKKPVTVSLDAYREMTHPSRIGSIKYESTVGAGTPIVAAISRLIAAGDSVKKIQGTFSGTLGYVMTGVSDKPFSAVVREAKKLGYTEPDPRDDLGGTDVARKALILGRALGWELEMDQVKVEPLYPPHFASLSVDEFMSRLDELDGPFTQKHRTAVQEGKVLRYVALLEDGKISVGLQALSADSPIGRLRGTDNMVEFYTGVYSKSPLVVQGSGAGGETTAHGVIADAVELALRN